MHQPEKSIAIITGASSGLGEEFVKQLATDTSFTEFWLIARRKQRLENLAEQIQQIQADAKQHTVRVLSLDLCKTADLENLQQLIEEQKPRIRWLVNNAGFGLAGNFAKLPMPKQLEMIDLNIKALTFISGICLPYMKRGDHLIMTASTAGFFPLPQFAVYAATKAYVVSFANALAAELASKGIHVTALCPGPVATEFIELAYPGNQAYKKLPAAEVQDVVKKALHDARKGSIRSTYGLAYEMLVLLSGVVPRRSLLWAPVNKLLEKFPEA